VDFAVLVGAADAVDDALPPLLLPATVEAFPVGALSVDALAAGSLFDFPDLLAAALEDAAAVVAVEVDLPVLADPAGGWPSSVTVK